MDENKTVTCLGWIVFLAVTVIVACVLNGWALSVLWGWFMVPTFGAPALGIVQAIGIAIVLNFILEKQSNNNTEKEKTSDLLISLAAQAVGRPLFAVGFGWIVLQFM